MSGSAQGPSFSSGQDVGRRIRMMLDSSRKPTLTVKGNCLEHQVTSQPSIGAVGNHIHSATSEAVQQGASEWPRRLLW